MGELSVGDKVSFVKNVDSSGWETKGYGEVVSISHGGEQIFIRVSNSSKYICADKNSIILQKGE